MADSQSLALLPPQAAAAPTSDTTIAKKVKPAPDKSFGHKLDKATKKIVAKKVDLKPVAVPAKPATANASKSTNDADPDAVKEPVDQAQKGVARLPKPAVKDPKDAVESEEEGETKSATKTVEPTAVKSPSPANATTEGPKKAVKKAEAKNPAAKSSTVQTTADRVNPNQTVTSDNDQSTNDGADADSTDAIAGGDNALFGSGKVVGKGNPGDSASAAADAATSGTDTQTAAENASAETDPMVTTAAEIATTDDAPVVKTAIGLDSHTPGVAQDTSGLAASTSAASPTALAAKSSVPSTATSPQVRFAEDNHPKIITSIAGELLPKGGTMQLQLNPADLGALQVTVHMQDGVVSASFETSNDNATKMLSHSLGQLKSGLEAAGVSVEKLHVEQAPEKNASKDSNSESDSKSPLQDQQRQAQQDQQRKDMVQRMWRRLAGGSDPLDLVA